MEEEKVIKQPIDENEFTAEESTKKRIKIIVIIVIGLIIIIGIIVAIVLLLKDNSSSSESNSLDKIDMSKWLYNEDDSLYYQLGITYCNKPIDLKYQQLAIFIPKQYMECNKSTKNNDIQYYKCEINNNNKINNFNSKNAPFVFEIETPGYAAAESITEYPNNGNISPKDYTKNGIIYFFPGCRGREHGAPLGVVDLKISFY